MLQPTFRGPFRKLLIFEHQELIANVFSSHITFLKYGNARNQSKNHTFAERTWNTQTLGKKIDWFTKKAFLAYMERRNESHYFGLPKPWYHSPNETHWARHLPCANQTSSWDCMFGNASATTTKDMTPYDEKVNMARKIWDLRTCIFSKKYKCGDASPHHLKSLLLGWTFRYSLPLNACEANYRSDCQRNIVSLRNLDASKIIQRVFLSVHMRMGDACDKVETLERLEPFHWGKGWKQRPCILPVGYTMAIERVTIMYGVTGILLASDSEDAFIWAKNQTKHDVHYLDMDRDNLDTHDKGWIEKRDDIGHVEVDGAL